MRVCLLNDSFPPMIDGVANTVLNYARVLTGIEGCEAMVGTPRYPHADYSAYPFTVVPYASFNIGKLVEGYRAGNPLDVKVIRAASDFMPDVIHSHCPVSSTVLARIIRNETGAPVIMTYHTKFDEDIAKAVRLKWMQESSAKILAANISACDEVWTVSEGAGENLRSIGYEGEYRVVTNGVDFPKGRVNAEEVGRLLGGYDLPAGVPLLLYVGRMMTYKGLPLLIDALRILSDSGTDFRMVFVGGGADEEILRQMCLDAGFPADFYQNGELTGRCDGRSGRCGKILFTGPVRDRTLLRAWNTRADLFTFPSTYDTNGIVVREAAACGLASLLIRGSCAAEGIDDGVNGFMTEADAGAIARTLRQLCANPDRMRAAGIRAMDEIYISWEDSVKHAHDLYGDLIERKKAGALPEKTHGFTNKALLAAARLDLAFWKAIEKPKALIEGMLENDEKFSWRTEERRTRSGRAPCRRITAAPAGTCENRQKRVR